MIPFLTRLFAQAIAVKDDPHLQDGVHFFAHPTLDGLPITPLAVSRVHLGPGARNMPLRTDVVWRDEDGRSYTPPFTVSPGRPVTAHLPAGKHCVWARVYGEPRVVRTLTMLFRAVGLASTGDEDAPVAIRSEAPYDVAASHLVKVRVEGTGTVHGIEWLDEQDVIDRTKPTNWRVLSLPISRALNYQDAGTVDRVAESDARVAAGAPKAFGLHERPDPDTPEAAVPIAQTQRQILEKYRVNERFKPFRPALQQMLDSPDPARHTLVTEGVVGTDSEGHPITSRMELSTLAMILGSLIDPGIARKLGFADLDATQPGEDGEVVAYIITARFAGRPVKASTGEGSLADGLLATEGPVDVSVVAAATLGAPPDRPERVSIGPVDPGRWTPDPEENEEPGAVRRTIQIPVGGMGRATALAVAREQGAHWRTLSTRIGVLTPPRYAPVLPTVAVSGRGVRLGADPVVIDTGAPPAGYRLRVAQVDLFGRFGRWVHRDVPPKPRPLPPLAALEADYLHADPDSGEVSGEVRVRVPLPEALQAGAWPVVNVHLEFEHRTGSWEAMGVDPLPASGPAVRFVFDGPPLERAETRSARVRARFEDAAGQLGPVATWTPLALFDARPPPAPEIDPTLTYGSRPDALGLSRLSLSWEGRPGAWGYRVLFADETRLVARTAGLEVEGPDAARAEQIQAHEARFPRKLFTLLTGEALPRTARMRFEHQVSGALGTVCFFKVLEVTPGGVETPWREARLVARGVPNAPRPTVPLLELAAPPSVEEPVTLRVRMPRGGPHPVGFRLRRSRRESEDPQRMPIAVSGAVPPRPDPDTPSTFEIVDPGGSEDTDAQLLPWHRYTWLVEVRAPSYPTETMDLGGEHGPLPGDWSPPSAPVTAIVVGPVPEVGAVDLTATRTPVGVWIRWTHPDTLAGGELGSYQFDVLRSAPGEAPKLVGVITPFVDGSRQRDLTQVFEVLDPDPPRQAFYRVILRDPLGRRGPVATTETV